MKHHIKKPILVAATIITVLMVISMLWQNYSASKNEIKKISVRIENNTDLQMTGVHLREIDSNGSKWELVTRSAGYNFKSRNVDLEKPMARVSLASGEVVTVNSNHGFFNAENKTMEFSGGVETKLGEATKLFTTRMFYNSDQRRIYSTDNVRIDDKTVTLSGRGMEFFVGEKRFHILSNITAEVGR